jgi:hypothetical protein
MEADVEAARLKMKEATDAVERARYGSAGATRTASHEVALFWSYPVTYWIVKSPTSLEDFLSCNHKLFSQR